MNLLHSYSLKYVNSIIKIFIDSNNDFNNFVKFKNYKL